MLSQIEEHFHVLPLSEKSIGFGKILSTDTSLKILEAVYKSDKRVGISSSEVSEMLGIGRTTVLYHLARMQDSGLLETNPILKNDDSWNNFWKLYKNRGADLSAEQFNRIHDARMNGVKLFVPTKKGFLFLPSTDIDESKSIVQEMLTSINRLAIEGSYKRVKKASSLAGTVGLLLITLSFLFQAPVFLNNPSLSIGSLDRAVAPMENSAVSESFEPTPAPPASASKAGAESEGVSEMAVAPSASADSLNSVETENFEKGLDTTDSDDSVGGVVGQFESEKSLESESEFREDDVIALSVETQRVNEPSLVPIAVLYLGILLLGSSVGIYVFARFKK